MTPTYITHTHTPPPPPQVSYHPPMHVCNACRTQRHSGHSGKSTHSPPSSMESMLSVFQLAHVPLCFIRPIVITHRERSRLMSAATALNGHYCLLCQQLLSSFPPPFPLHLPCLFLFLSAPILFFLAAALQQGNRIPPDQVPKYKERKQFLDQIVTKDAEEIKRTCLVCLWNSPGVQLSVTSCATECDSPVLCWIGKEEEEVWVGLTIHCKANLYGTSNKSNANKRMIFFRSSLVLHVYMVIVTLSLISLHVAHRLLKLM